MSPAEAIVRLEILNPDALFLEPREYFDKAIVGVTANPNDHWPRQSVVAVAVYDASRTIHAIYDWFKATDAEYATEDEAWSAAADWFSFNTEGSWLGENTPTFVWRHGEDD